MGNFKAFVSGVVVTAVALQCGTFAYGKWMEEKISVIYQNIRVTVDDKELITSNEPFIYNGTTYLPVRDVAEAVGKKVSWDNERKLYDYMILTQENLQNQIKRKLQIRIALLFRI